MPWDFFFFLVIPAKAGIQFFASAGSFLKRKASTRLRRAGYFLALPKK
jgi:hypothetical protein